MTLPDPVFIVNTGRCGSTMLAEMMRENPSWLVLSEYLSYLSCNALSRTRLSGAAYWQRLSTQSPVLREMHLVGQRQPEILYEEGRHGDWPLHQAPAIMLATLPFLADDPRPLYAALEAAIRPRPVASVADHMRAAFQTLSEATGRPLWIERTGDSLLLTGRLRRLFPNARFVHLYRDGRDVAYSMKHKPDFRAKVSYFRTLRQIGLSPYRPNFAYGVAPWHGWVETLGAKVLDVRHFTDAEVTLRQCAEHWAWSIEAGLEELAAVPAAQVHSLRYEDLVARPAETLADLARFIDGSGAGDWIPRAARRSGGPVSYWQALPPAERQALEDGCGRALAALGYG